MGPLQSTQFLKSNKSIRQRGFAIVAAVWLSGIAMVIAVEFASRIRLNLLLTNQYANEVVLSAAAAGMSRLTALRTATITPDIAGGQTQFCTWDKRTVVAVEIQDHSGLIDLNAASADLFQLLFKHIGVDDNLATSLANEIIDYRDADTISVTGEQEAILRDGGRTPNRSYQTIEEIDLLPSMTDAVYVKARSFLTIYSGQSGVDLQQLPHEIVLPQNGLRTADVFLRYAIPSPKRSYRIRVVAIQKDRASYEVTSNIVVLQQPSRPFATLTWNEKILEAKIAWPTNQPAACLN